MFNNSFKNVFVVLFLLFSLTLIYGCSSKPTENVSQPPAALKGEEPSDEEEYNDCMNLALIRNYPHDIGKKYCKCEQDFLSSAPKGWEGDAKQIDLYGKCMSILIDYGKKH